MVFNIISRFVNAGKGAVTAGLKGTADVASSVVEVVKDTTISTLRETGDFIKEGLNVPASIVKGAFSGIAEIGASLITAARGIVKGAVQGFIEAGGSQD